MVTIIAAVLMEALFLLIVGMAGRVVETILLLLVVHAIYLVAVYHVLRRGCRQRLIIAAAIIFRFTVVPLNAPFTDDLARYRWEALVQDSGGNPYEVRPSDPKWGRLRDATYGMIPAKDFKAGYGPAWEMMSLGTLALARSWTSDPVEQVFWFKIPAAIFDLGTIGALSALLASRGICRSRVLIYAWAPAPIWEFWGNGHNDSIAIFLLISAFAVYIRWPLAAEALLGTAIATKWWPAILLPGFSWRAQTLRPVLVATCVVLGFAVPYWTDVTENTQFMSGFVGGWRNNDSLFGFLLYLTGDLYKAKYLAFGLLAVIALWLASRDWPLEKIALWTIVSVLLLSANCHPWYMTWLLPFLALYPCVPLLLWISLTPLAYIVLIRWQILGEWNGSTVERWWIYIPVLIWLAFGPVRLLISQQMAKRESSAGR
jgi:hypothetical protein